MEFEFVLALLKMQKLRQSKLSKVAISMLKQAAFCLGLQHLGLPVFKGKQPDGAAGVVTNRYHLYKI